MKLLEGICICGSRWYWTGERKSNPDCGQCGRKPKRDDEWRAEKRAARESKVA